MLPTGSEAVRATAISAMDVRATLIVRLYKMVVALHHLLVICLVWNAVVFNIEMVLQVLPTEVMLLVLEFWI